MGYNFLALAAEQYPFQPAKTARTHDDQVIVTRLDHRQDRFRCWASQDICFQLTGDFTNFL